MGSTLMQETWPCPDRAMSEGTGQGAGSPGKSPQDRRATGPLTFRPSPSTPPNEDKGPFCNTDPQDKEREQTAANCEVAQTDTSHAVRLKSQHL